MSAAPKYVLTAYFEAAMERGSIEQLDDGHFVGEIDDCPGLIVFARSEDECREELRSTLEGWVLLGLRLGHTLPVLDGIDLNVGRPLEPVNAS
jgi:predicted RNase H-like HicB family nuclease